MKRYHPTPIAAALVGALVVVLGIITLALVAGQAHADQAAQLAVLRARETVVTLLRDGESARFRDLRLHPSGAICGQVNARNAFGGYAGWQGVACVTPDQCYLEEQVASADWRRVWVALCE